MEDFTLKHFLKHNLHHRKTYFRQRIPGSSFYRKETVDTDMLITSRDGDRQIMQSIRMTSGPHTKIKKWDQFSQFRWTFTKVITVQKTEASDISMIIQRFKKGSKCWTNNPTYPFLCLSDTSK